VTEDEEKKLGELMQQDMMANGGPATTVQGYGLFPAPNQPQSTAELQIPVIPGVPNVR
jgi:hypothetical protein